MLRYAIEGVKISIDDLMKHDLPMMFTTALIVIGTVLSGFGFAEFVFNPDPRVAWIFWTLGFGFWLFGLAIFGLFFSRPEPKHGRSR